MNIDRFFNLTYCIKIKRVENNAMRLIGINFNKETLNVVIEFSWNENFNLSSFQSN